MPKILGFITFAAFVVLLETRWIFAADTRLALQSPGENWQIVISHQAAPAEKTAARELQHFIREICGAELKIVNDTAAAAKHEIILGGANQRLSGLDDQIDPAALGPEGFAIRT